MFDYALIETLLVSCACARNIEEERKVWREENQNFLKNKENRSNEKGPPPNMVQNGLTDYSFLDLEKTRHSTNLESLFCGERIRYL